MWVSYFLILYKKIHLSYVIVGATDFKVEPYITLSSSFVSRYKTFKMFQIK